MLTSTVGVVAIVATLAVFTVVGIRARDASGDLEDYTTARGSQDALPLGLSFFASGMGAWILFAPPEVGATVGLVAVLGYAVGAAAPLVAFAVLGRRMRAVVPRGHGLTEFVRLRFGRAFHAYVVAISVLYMLVFVTAELTAVGTVAGIVAGVDARVAIVLLAVSTVAYTAYGGLRASLRTDRWQAWMVLGLLAVGAVAIVAELPSPGAALADSGLLGIDRLGVESAVTLVIAVTAANIFHQGYWQRVFAARDDRRLGLGAGTGAAAVLPVTAVAGGFGLLAVGAGLELGAPPAPFFALLAETGGAVALAVLILGVALVASSVDTLENGLAALVVAERPSLDLRGARVVTVLLLVPALAVALQGLSVLRLFLVADLLCAATVVPALLGLTRWATTRGALGGAVAGLAGAVVPGWMTAGSLTEGLRLASFPGAVPTLDPFLGALVASTVVATVLSLPGRATDLDELADRVPALTSSAS